MAFDFKKEYHVGQTFETDGMVVTAYYSNSTSKPVTGYTVSPEKFETEESDATVTITYTEGNVTKTATVTVNVGPDPGYTKDDEGTYMVYNADGLMAWAAAAQDDPSISCTLTDDITLTSDWTPISSTFAGTFDGNNKYISIIKRVIKHPKRVMTGFAVIIIMIATFNSILPTSFLPVEDQGYFRVELELPEGATLERTRTVTNRAIDYIMENPYVAYVQNVTGSSPRVGTNQARADLTVILKPWDERDDVTIDEIMADFRREFSLYPECKVYITTPPVIPGLGTAGGFEMQLEARGEATFDDLVRAVDTLMYYAGQREEVTGLKWNDAAAKIKTVYEAAIEENQKQNK